MARQWLLALLAGIGVVAFACGGGTPASSPASPGSGSQETPEVSPAAAGEEAGAVGDLIRGGAALTPTFPLAILPSSPGDPEVLARCQQSLKAPESFRYTMESSWGLADPEGLLEEMRAAKAAALDSLIRSGVTPDQAQKQVDDRYGDLNVLPDEAYVTSQQRTEGEFQAPDRWLFTATGDDSPLSGEYRVVGDTVWKNEGGAWAVDETASQGDVDAATVPVEEETLCAGLASLAAMHNVDSSQEMLGGVATTHYHLGTDAVNDLSASAAEEAGGENVDNFVSADLDMWIAQDSYWPLSMRFEAVFDFGPTLERSFDEAFGATPTPEGTPWPGEAPGAVALMMRATFDAGISDVNDPSIQIEAPAAP